MSGAAHPSSLGKYEIRGTLGRGAMGTVYDGWDPAIHRRVAIKTVRLPDAHDEEAIDGLARFKREAQAAGRLSHPNIVGVFDYGETAELAYIVMEFVDGRSLKEVLSAGERMSSDNAVRLMQDVLAGLAYSHGRGVVHRDIKPANIMMAGETMLEARAKIADFGIARIEASSMTQAGTVLGTPAYMSPEQFMGQVVDRRTDIYSSGVMLYQLLAGERPFEGSMTAIMHKALTTTPPRPSELAVTSPASLDGVVAKAMARRPEDRYATAEEFAAALRGHAVVPDDPFASDETMVAAPRPATTRPAAAQAAAAQAAAAQAAAAPQAVVAPPPPKRGSRTPAFAGAGVAAVAIVAAAAWFLLPAKTTPTEPAAQQATLDTPRAATPATSATSATSATPATPIVGSPAAQPSAGPAPSTLPPMTTAQAVTPAIAAPSAAEPSPIAAPAAAPSSALPSNAALSVAASPNETPGTAAAPQQQTQSAPPSPIAARQQTAPALPPAQVVGQAPPPPTTTVAAQDAQSSSQASSPFLIPSTSAQPPSSGAPSAGVSAGVAPSPEPLAVTASPALPEAPTARDATPPPVAPTPMPHASASAASAPAANEAAAAPTAASSQRLAALVPVVPPAVSAPARSAAAIQAALSVTVPTTACSLVRTSLADGGDVVVSGVSGAQPALREAVAAAGPADIAWRVQGFDGPYCPALDLLRTASDNGHGRAGLELGQIGGPASLTDNAVIALRATMPGFGGYLHVAYLQHDATVSPLVPGPGYPLQTYPAGSPIDLGTERSDFPGWHVGPPFGTDMIVAVASTAPLFTRPLPDSQPLPAYLAALRSAMADLRRHGGSLAAAAVVLDTRPTP